MEIALKEVHCASPDTNLNEIASMMREHGVGVIPICEEKKLLGIITDRDIVINCLAMTQDGAKCKAREFMSYDTITATPDMDLEEAAQIMSREQVRRLPVVENNNLVGILTLGDISRALANSDKLIADTFRQISTFTKGTRTH
jgi:CBS domain-containing protein